MLPSLRYSPRAVRVVLSTPPLVLYSAYSTPSHAISNLLYALVHKRYRKEQRYRLPVLYDKYSTGGAFAAPTQNTISGFNLVRSGNN